MAEEKQPYRYEDTLGPTTKKMLGTLDKGIEIGGKVGSAISSGVKKGIDATTIDPEKLKSNVGEAWKKWTTKKPVPKVEE